MSDQERMLMEFKEIVAPTMKELIIKELTGKILSGECVIGEKLPTEREMEKQMKVSKTIINSALMELSRIKFVKIIPRHGVFVEDFVRNGNIDTLTAITNFNDGKLDKHTFDSLMYYRKNTECKCAELSAKNRTEEDIQLLESLYDQIQKETDTSVTAKLKVDFHHALFCSTGNTIYPLVYNSFYNLSIIFNEVIFKNVGVAEGTLYLPELISAIKNKQPQNARTVMNKLTDKRIRELERYYFNDY